jgi:hypothetical protein
MSSPRIDNFYNFVLKFAVSCIKRDQNVSGPEFYITLYPLWESAVCHGFLNPTLPSEWLASAIQVSHGFLDRTFYPAGLFQHFHGANVDPKVARNTQSMSMTSTRVEVSTEIWRMQSVFQKHCSRFVIFPIFVFLQTQDFSSRSRKAWYL